VKSLSNILKELYESEIGMGWGKDSSERGLTLLKLAILLKGSHIKDNT